MKFKLREIVDTSRTDNNGSAHGLVYQLFESKLIDYLRDRSRSNTTGFAILHSELANMWFRHPFR